MKKIFSLLCAMVLVMSASAVNPIKKADLVVASQISQKADRSQRTRNFQSALLGKANSVMAQAPTRVQDEVIICDYAEAAGYDSYYGDGSWDITLYNGTTPVGLLSIIGDCDGTHIAGFYDLANADAYGYPGFGISFDGQTLVDATSGTFTIAYVSAGTDGPVYHITGTFVINGTTYTIDSDVEVFAYDYFYYEYYGYIDEIILQDDGGSSDPYAYDEQTNVTISYTSAEATLEYDDSYQALSGVVKIFIDKNDGSDELYLRAVYSTPLVGGVMPDGVYQITATEAEGTFLASSGYDGRYVYPCLYGLLGTSGGFTNAWFLVSGTVTISNNGQNIAVVATNSNGNTVNYTFTNAPQAVENVEGAVKAVKSIKNGQLVIEKNGVEYNAQGAKL